MHLAVHDEISFLLQPNGVEEFDIVAGSTLGVVELVPDAFDHVSYVAKISLLRVAY